MTDSTLNRCGTCKHYHKGDRIFLEGWGDCRLIQDDPGPYHDSEVTEFAVLARAWDYEGMSAGLRVNVRFGCVHHEVEP